MYRIAEILVLRKREISATKNVAFEMTISKLFQEE